MWNLDRLTSFQALRWTIDHTHPSPINHRRARSTLRLDTREAHRSIVPSRKKACRTPSACSVRKHYPNPNPYQSSRPSTIHVHVCDNDSRTSHRISECSTSLMMFSVALSSFKHPRYPCNLLTVGVLLPIEQTSRFPWSGSNALHL